MTHTRTVAARHCRGPYTLNSDTAIEFVGPRDQ